jgi:hypothetical protein
MEECFVTNQKYIFMEIVINFDERWIVAQTQEPTIVFLVQQSRFTAAKKVSRRVPVSFHYGRALAVQGRATGWTVGSGSRLEQEIALFYRVSRPAQPASLPLVTGGSFPEGKAAGAWNWPLVSILSSMRKQWSMRQLYATPQKLYGVAPNYLNVGTTLPLKNAVFWDVAQCRSCVNRRFGGTYCLHLHGRKIR